jgi:Sec-independent protein secretion pathway component TatC
VGKVLVFWFFGFLVFVVFGTPTAVFHQRSMRIDVVKLWEVSLSMVKRSGDIVVDQSGKNPARFAS